MDPQGNGVQGVDFEVQRVVQAARDALTDEMVERLATTVADAADLLDKVNRSGLGAAIPAIAELVHNGDLARVVKLARVYGSAEDALTDEMVGRLATTVAEGADLMDRVHRSGLGDAIPALAELVHNGDLARIVKLARVYGSAEDALTDEMIGRLMDTLGNGLSLLDRFARGGAERVVAILEGLERSGALQQLAESLPDVAGRMARLQAMAGAVDAAAVASRTQPRSRGGVGGLWQMMRDPDTQDTLRFLLEVGRQLRSLPAEAASRR
ncbi:MAG: DUF1641 domain-containing protein [Burkholderiales bacterium]|nr:DUF1641 domain-containing protein [Burkholderiales bacterium]